MLWTRGAATVVSTLHSFPLVVGPSDLLLEMSSGLSLAWVTFAVVVSMGMDPWCQVSSRLVYMATRLKHKLWLEICSAPMINSAAALIFVHLDGNCHLTYTVADLFLHLMPAVDRREVCFSCDPISSSRRQVVRIHLYLNAR